MREAGSYLLLANEYERWLDSINTDQNDNNPDDQDDTLDELEDLF